MNLITGQKFSDLPGVIFCKIDNIKSLQPALKPYILVTHNGDMPITEEYKYILDDPLLIRWFGINTTFVHDKLITIPIGINYEDKTLYPNDLQIGERERIIKACMGSLIEKECVISDVANLRIRDLPERVECEKALNRNGIKNVDSYQFGDYLVNLKRSMFTPCPKGFGIDTFRLWECLYMKSIPICILTEYNRDLYPNLPIYWIDSWASFDKDYLSESIYFKMWVDTPLIDFEYWKNKIEILWI